MELVNGTPLAADLFVTELEEGRPRIGLLMAKATFRFDAGGGVELDRDDPYPVFRGDEEVEHGVLPGDLVTRNDPAFEVVVVGEAHAAGSEAVDSMYVTLAVGEEVRHLLVTGDRWWRIQLDTNGDVAPEACTPTPPEPFRKMPLGWERAFGGTADILVDHEAPLEVAHRLNPMGRGFDPEPMGHQIGLALEAPDGFPVVERVRALPNVEDPAHPVQQWEDDPPPASWAPLPVGSPMVAQAAYPSGEDIDPEAALQVPPAMLHRAHPDWVIPLPERGARIFLRGLVPDAPELSLALPDLRVLADYVVADREGTAELRPHLMALLPSERRFYILYRYLFQFAFDPMTERAFKLRTERGWFEDSRERS